MPGGPDDYAVGGSVSEVQRGDVTTVRFPWMGYGLRENKVTSSIAVPLFLLVLKTSILLFR